MDDGDNRRKELGLGDNSQDNISTPMRINSYISYDNVIHNMPIQCKYVSCYNYGTFLIDMDDNLFAFGVNFGGRFGIEAEQIQSIPKQVGNFKVKQVSCGVNHAFIIDLDDNVWGSGIYLMGLYGMMENYNEFILMPNIKAKQVSCGDYHTLLIDLDDNVWGLGHTGSAPLGIGNLRSRNASVQITSYILDGQLQNTPIKASKIICGGYASLIIDYDNNIYFTGRNLTRVIGNVSEIDIYIPTQIPNIKAFDAACYTECIAIIGVRTD